MEERPIDEAHPPPHTLPHLSPEARRLRAGIAATVREGDNDSPFGPGSRPHRIFTRVWTGAWNDGFIHAGNLAYTTIVALFPFFILGAAVFSAIGEPQEREASVRAFLMAVPRVVREVLAPVAHDVVEARQGWLLWLGALVGLWTMGSLIETVRDVLRRAYGTPPTHAYWLSRLLSTGIIIGAVIGIVVSLSAQVAFGALEDAIAVSAPGASDLIGRIAFGRLLPAIVLYASLHFLFRTLTPAPYNVGGYPKWPGALFVTLWWAAVSAALPWALRTLFYYDLTYGSLAGVMIALFFFWLVGLGLVVGAELNAALAESPEERDALGRCASAGDANGGDMQAGEESA